MRVRRGQSITATALAAATACLAALTCSDDNAGPTSVATGIYHLVTVDGAPLPWRFATYPFGGHDQMLSARIEFRSRGRLVDIVSVQQVTASGTEGPVQADTSAHAY